MHMTREECIIFVVLFIVCISSLKTLLVVLLKIFLLELFTEEQYRRTVFSLSLVLSRNPKQLASERHSSTLLLT